MKIGHRKIEAVRQQSHQVLSRIQLTLFLRLFILLRSTISSSGLVSLVGKQAATWSAGFLETLTPPSFIVISGISYKTSKYSQNEIFFGPFGFGLVKASPLNIIAQMVQKQFKELKLKDVLRLIFLFFFLVTGRVL
jgi:hypothetical protein